VLRASASPAAQPHQPEPRPGAGSDTPSLPDALPLSGPAAGHAARHAGPGGARRPVPPGLDRPGAGTAHPGRDATLAAGTAHADARSGRLPRLLLLLPGADPADGGGLPRPRPGTRLGPSGQPRLDQRLPPLGLGAGV